MQSVWRINIPHNKKSPHRATCEGVHNRPSKR
nr:MAG TPA: hypothetical protein [Caudoviricetes sp.]